MRAPVLPTFLPPPRRRSLSGFSVSTVLHGLLLLVIISPWFRRYHLLSAEGSDLVGTGGGGGGGGERYIALPLLRAEAQRPAPVVPPVTPPPVPAPTVTPTEIPPPTPAPDSVPQPQPAAQSAAGGTGTGSTTGQGSGTGGGTGGGQGPGTGAGAGPGPGGSQRGVPPENRQMLFPPLEGTPRALRGKSVTVRFYVNIDGRVDRVETIPAIEDGKFAREFEQLMKSYRFRPAKDSLGAIVAGIAVAGVTLSNH